MLTLAKIFAAQKKYGATSNVGDSEKVTYEMYLASCRRLLSDKTPADYYNWDRRRQTDFTDNLIIQYVRNNLKEVDGFVDELGEVKMDDLIERLRSDIADYGILREALEDENVQEIQINDFKTIWIIIGGKAKLYTDKNGLPYQFVSDTELHSTVNRLIYNPDGNSPRMTVTNPLINTRTTAKGYRLSGVNSSAITPDMKVGFDFPCTSITIRKYSQSRLTFEDFIKYGTMTPKMAEFLRFCGRANIRLACVGPTSSGKTTLLNAIVWEIPRDNRLLLVQNPTEIMIYERSDETGVNMRNAVHWEASEVDQRLKNDPTTPTMANFIAHSLRNTPDVIIPGEVRTPEEFFQMNRALKTGHRVLTTFHATDGADAVERMATELATLGGSVTDYLSSIIHSIDIVVSQKKLEDGNRHVMAIEELTGKVNEFGKAETRVLFRYKLTGETVRDENGKLIEIKGYFEQVNPISDELRQKFFEAGIDRSELADFLEVSNSDDDFVPKTESSYTGQELDTDAINEIFNQTPTSFADTDAFDNVAKNRYQQFTEELDGGDYDSEPLSSVNYNEETEGMPQEEPEEQMTVEEPTEYAEQLAVEEPNFSTGVATDGDEEAYSDDTEASEESESNEPCNEEYEPSEFSDDTEASEESESNEPCNEEYEFGGLVNETIAYKNEEESSISESSEKSESEEDDIFEDGDAVGEDLEDVEESPEEAVDEVQESDENFEEDSEGFEENFEENSQNFEEDSESFEEDSDDFEDFDDFSTDDEEDIEEASTEETDNGVSIETTETVAEAPHFSAKKNSRWLNRSEKPVDSAVESSAVGLSTEENIEQSVESAVESVDTSDNLVEENVSDVKTSDDIFSSSAENDNTAEDDFDSVAEENNIEAEASTNANDMLDEFDDFFSSLDNVPESQEVGEATEGASEEVITEEVADKGFEEEVDESADEYVSDEDVEEDANEELSERVSEEAVDEGSKEDVEDLFGSLESEPFTEEETKVPASEELKEVEDVADVEESAATTEEDEDDFFSDDVSDMFNEVPENAVADEEPVQENAVVDEEMPVAVNEESPKEGMPVEELPEEAVESATVSDESTQEDMEMDENIDSNVFEDLVVSSELNSSEAADVHEQAEESELGATDSSNSSSDDEFAELFGDAEATFENTEDEQPSATVSENSVSSVTESEVVSEENNAFEFSDVSVEDNFDMDDFDMGNSDEDSDDEDSSFKEVSF